MPVGMTEGRGEIIMKMTKHSAGAVSRSKSSGYYRVKKAASYLKSKEMIMTLGEKLGRDFF